MSRPVSSGRNVSFATLSGSVHSISRSDGSLTFQFETDGQIRTPLAYNHDSLFVASDDGRFYCIDIDNGRLKWTFVSGLPIRQQPRVIEESVYVAPDAGGLYSLNIGTGRIRWHQLRGTEFLAAAGDRIFASDQLGNVLVLSRSDGSVRATLPLRAMSVRVNNDRTDRLYLASTTGVVLTLKEQDSEFPTYHKFPERQPLLPLLGPAPEDEMPAEEPAAEPDADAAPVAPGDAAPVAPGEAAPVAPGAGTFGGF
jgi:outer membrane protein assembly factor BamB